VNWVRREFLDLLVLHLPAIGHRINLSQCLSQSPNGLSVQKTIFDSIPKSKGLIARDPRQIPELLGDRRGSIPEVSGDTLGIVPETLRDFLGISVRIFRSEEPRLETCLRPSAALSASPRSGSRIPQWEFTCSIALRIMARIAKKKQGSSVARNIFSAQTYQELASSRRNIFVIRRSRSFHQPSREIMRANTPLWRSRAPHRQSAPRQLFLVQTRPGRVARPFPV